MFDRRQLRLRVMDALERLGKQFRSREELWPIRIPREPVPLDDVIEQAMSDDNRSFDPIALRARTLLHLQWRDGSTWEAWVIILPSGVKLYCDSSHAGDDETRVLASGGPNAGDESDRLFLQLLSESGGQHFGLEMAGGAPSRVRSCIRDHDFLEDVFVELFEVTSSEESVRAELAAAGPQKLDDSDADGTDFRSDVRRWLAQALESSC
ncbi:MAG: hypothetical protein LC753_04290 [Acidobacteria bacterium]|nr:hypothetical protein [Acidobacteriota bacterium]MCA1649518.1 hypothetical protein [Acidobacteriota bacterium]